MFSGIFQRPLAHILHTVTYCCTTPFHVAPEDYVRPRVSQSVSWPWRFQWVVHNTELHQLLSTQSARAHPVSPLRSQREALSRAVSAALLGMDRTELHGCSEELLNVWWTPKHTTELQSDRIYKHTQRAMSMLRKWGQTKAHLQTTSCGKISSRANDPSLYPRLNPSLAVRTSKSGSCSNWDLNQTLWVYVQYLVILCLLYHGLKVNTTLGSFFFLIGQHHTVGWKTIFLYHWDLWFSKYFFLFLFFWN